MPAHCPRIVIGFAGRIGAGKTTAARHLQEFHGFHYIRYSHVLAQWKASDPAQKSELQEKGWEVMADEERQRELNRRLIAEIKDAGNTVVDGLRHRIDQQSLKGEFHDCFGLVFISANQELRWKRSLARHAKREDFMQADDHQVEQFIDGLASLSDLIISNEATEKELLKSVDKFSQSMAGEK